MISSPRVLDYELIIIDFAIDLLESFGKQELFKKSSLEDDILHFTKENDYKMRFIL